MGKERKHIMIATIFLACQLFGLYVVNYYVTNDLPFGFEPLADEGVLSLTKFVLMLAGITIVILTLIKLGKMMVWKIMYFLGVSAAVMISLNVFVGSYALPMAFLVSWLKLREDDDFWHNLSEILLYGGAVAVISPMFNPATSLILLAIIAFYDIYSVNYSKHMVKMAKAQTRTGVFPGLVINKGGKDQSVLGGGDIAFPLLFASAFIKTPLISLAVVLSAFAGLFFLLTNSQKGKYYPAMPVLTVSSVTGYVIGAGLLFLF
jgi:presenilin-like A22 family membrane protease